MFIHIHIKSSILLEKDFYCNDDDYDDNNDDDDKIGLVPIK